MPMPYTVRTAEPALTWAVETHCLTELPPSERDRPERAEDEPLWWARRGAALVAGMHNKMQESGYVLLEAPKIELATTYPWQSAPALIAHARVLPTAAGVRMADYDPSDFPTDRPSLAPTRG